MHILSFLLRVLENSWWEVRVALDFFELASRLLARARTKQNKNFEEVGLKWADGVASPLRGEFLLKEPAQDTVMEQVVAPEGQPGWEYISSTPIESWIAKITTAYNSPWLEKIEEAYRRHHISEGVSCCLTAKS